MKIKRFFAKDMRTALAEIKESLGVDAIIMSNKKTADGVEIVAAIDEDNNAPLPKKAPASAPAQETVAGNSAAPSGRSLDDDQISLSGFQQRLVQHLGSSQEQQTPAAWQPQPQSQPSGGEADVADGLQALLQRQEKIRHQGLGQLSSGQEGSGQVGSGHASPGQQNFEQQGRGQQGNVHLGNGQRAPEPVPHFQQQQQQQQHQQQPQGQHGWHATEQPVQGGVGSEAANQPAAGMKPLNIGAQAGFPDGSGYKGFEPQPAQSSAEMDELRNEMSSLRQLLEHQVSGLMSQDIDRREPVRAMLHKQLQQEGFDAELAAQFVADIPGNLPVDQARQLLGGSIRKRLLSTENDILVAGGVVALLGPTGVGKTTTVAKLAARYAMQYGADQVALITTDSYRIGAHEQLSTYGKILGCPVKVAKDAQQLAEALHQLRNRRLILIDTAGMGQRDVRLSEQLATLMTGSHVNIRSYLVLSATAQRKVLQESIVHFRKIPLSGCILTKLDEALGIAEILSVAIQHGLPLGYLTDGQRVPEDIGIADVDALVNRVISDISNHSNTGVGSNETLTSQFASVNR